MTAPITPLIEKPHLAGSGTQKLYRFDNGYGASVVRFTLLGGLGGSYGASEGLWEMAVLQWKGDDDYELTYDTPITEDVIGWLSDEEVEEKLRAIRDLPAVSDAG